MTEAIVHLTGRVSLLQVALGGAMIVAVGVVLGSA